MAQRTATADRLDLQHLPGDLVHDGRRLLGQQSDLFRSEARSAVRRAGGAGAEIAAGRGLTAAGGVLAGLSLALLIRKATGLPLWDCCGLAGRTLGAAGVGLLKAGGDRLAGVRPLPRSAAALGENLAWLSNQLAAPGR